VPDAISAAIRAGCADLGAAELTGTGLAVRSSATAKIRNRVDQHTVAMGVVVQRMVRSEASGVLFTANPTSGDRDELVINASFGLGEAVVSGDMTRDRTS
jgi:hypothetical protein